MQQQFWKKKPGQNFLSFSTRNKYIFIPIVRGVKYKHNFMNLNVYIPFFLMKPFVLCFCCGRCRVCFYWGHFEIADVYSRQ